MRRKVGVRVVGLVEVLDDAPVVDIVAVFGRDGVGELSEPFVRQLVHQVRAKDVARYRMVDVFLDKLALKPVGLLPNLLAFVLEAFYHYGVVVVVRAL